MSPLPHTSSWRSPEGEVLVFNCEDLLLSDYCELGKYTRPVSRQRLGKHEPRATNRSEKMEMMLEMGFSTRSVQRRYRQRTKLKGEVSNLRQQNMVTSPK
jgi:hypothetical protein